MPADCFAVPYNRHRVRIYSNVTERPVEAEVRQREEHVHVERRPMDRSVSNADMSAFKEGVIEVT
ncbi:MAG: YsnF/AvaK domain-containing protein, partial [Acidobacteriota bacterium]|nr:YsnF/AvaK domain-containing protein [Acidobacteriota bacterium]